MRSCLCRLAVLSVCTLLPLMSLAVEGVYKDNLEALPEVPEPPSALHDGETIEPDITIYRKEKKTIQEFRRNGQLYMIKIIPEIGAPYYFLDTNNDGQLDVRSGDLDKGSRVNLWKLLEWK